MRIAISGASGYIGSHLTSFFAGQQHNVISLGRSLFREDHFSDLVLSMEGCDVIINLAGAPINKRWTKAYKKIMYNSRISVTRQLVYAIKELKTKPQLMISTSAVGYYPSKGSYDEYNERQGSDFLAKLCRDWEQEARQCSPEVRLVIMRLGVVLSADGGALQQMLCPLKLTHVSATIGSGGQPFPWIGISDLCHSIDFIIRHQEMQGVVNITVPQQITQKHLAKTLAKAYRAWMVLPAPLLFFRLIYGEGVTFLAGGQNVRPAKLMEADFPYTSPSIEAFLNISSA